MQNSQGGFTVPLLLVILVVILGGGAYFYNKNVTTVTDIKQGNEIESSDEQVSSSHTTEVSSEQKSNSTDSFITRTSATKNEVASITKVNTDFSDTISNVLRKEDNVECSFSTSKANPYDGNNMYTYMGNLFISQDKFRVDRNTSSANIKLESHSLFDGRYLYSWSNSGLQLKVDANKYFPSVSRKVGNETLLDPIDTTRVYSFTCKTFSDSGKTFLPDSTIKFIELSK